MALWHPQGPPPFLCSAWFWLTKKIIWSYLRTNAFPWPLVKTHHANSSSSFYWPLRRVCASSLGWDRRIFFDPQGGSFWDQDRQKQAPGVCTVKFWFWLRKNWIGHIFGPLHSHDLSSRPIILSRQALSNGTNGVRIRYSHYQSNRSQVTDHQPLIWPYMANICSICRSYIGHIWAIHKLYISHVQPTVQATEGP